jgi:hypothetical protein
MATLEESFSVMAHLHDTELGGKYLLSFEKNNLSKKNANIFYKV